MCGSPDERLDRSRHSIMNPIINCIIISEIPVKVMASVTTIAMRSDTINDRFERVIRGLESSRVWLLANIAICVPSLPAKAERSLLTASPHMCLDVSLSDFPDESVVSSPVKAGLYLEY